MASRVVDTLRLHDIANYDGMDTDVIKNSEWCFTLPIVWIRGGYRGAFTGWAVITVVPLVGGHWFWGNIDTISSPFNITEHEPCINMKTSSKRWNGSNVNFMQTTSKWLWACRSFVSHVNVMWFLFLMSNTQNQTSQNIVSLWHQGNWQTTFLFYKTLWPQTDRMRHKKQY